MKDSTQMLLKENLKALNLSHMSANIERLVRQARESGAGLDESIFNGIRASGTGRKQAEAKTPRCEVSSSENV